MKRIMFIVSAFTLLTAFTGINSLWQNDDAHSQLGFTIKHLGISDVSGTFNDFDATITATKADFSDAVVELKAEVASIDTRVTARDNHLKSADFFDVAKYPSLHFKSTSLKRVNENNYLLSGNLTMHGITKPVTLNLHYAGSVENPMSKKQTSGFQVKGTILRSDFNIGNGFPAAVISDEVEIKADGEFIQ